jgi:hypothetical protein
MWLWWVNGAGLLAIAAAAIVQPIAINSAPCDVPECDPHGYILIFTAVPAAGVAILALVGLLVLGSGDKLGFGIALAAAAACAGLLVWNGIGGLSAQLIWPTAALALVVAALAVAGLRLVPPRPPRKDRLVEPPYPPVA